MNIIGDRNLDLLTKLAGLTGVILPLLLSNTGLFSNSAVAQEPPEPIFGRITLNQNFTPNPYIEDGVSGGNIPATTITPIQSTPTGSCQGYMKEEPDFELDLAQSFRHLALEVQSSADTTLIVTNGEGTWCNDDYNGQPNPQINGSWSQGLYRIWVGSYKENHYSPYELRISR